MRFEAIYGNTREANRGSTFSPEASLEQAGGKLIKTDLQHKQAASWICVAYRGTEFSPTRSCLFVDCTEVFGTIYNTSEGNILSTHGHDMLHNADFRPKDASQHLDT